MPVALDQLQSMMIFARVVEAMSFTHAAHALGISKSAVSARVTALEARLGVRLLHRTTRRLALTRDGVRLYEQCARVLRIADEAADALGSVSREPEGIVRVTAPVSVGLIQLPEMLAGFAERYPRVWIDVSLSERQVDLVAEGFDVAIRAAQRLRDSTLIARRLGSERLLACGAPSYFARHPVPGTPHDLTQHNCLRLSVAGREWTFQGDGEPVVVPVSGSLIVDNMAALRQAALIGIGLAMLPASLIAGDVEHGHLQPVLRDYLLSESGLFLVHPYRKHLPRKVRVFVDYLVEHFRERKSSARAVR